MRAQLQLGASRILYLHNIRCIGQPNHIPAGWYFWTKIQVDWSHRSIASFSIGVNARRPLERDSPASVLIRWRSQQTRSDRVFLSIAFRTCGWVWRAAVDHGPGRNRCPARSPAVPRAATIKSGSRYLSENHVLNDIRSDVYVSGTYVRDYLLEPEPQRADAYRASLEEVRKHMQAALDSYGRQVAAGRSPALHHSARRTDGLLGDSGSDLSLGRGRKAPFRLLLSARRSVPAPAEYARACRPDCRPQRSAVGCREPASRLPVGELPNSVCF